MSDATISATVPRVTRPRHRWRRHHLLACILLAVVSVIATFDAWSDMARLASRDEEASHIFLVPVVAGWLIYLRAGRMRLCRQRGQWLGAVIVALGCAMYALGDQYMVQVAWHLGAVVILIGCVLSVLGSDIVRRFFPALLVLAFLAPVPGIIRQSIANPLQGVTAQITQALLALLDVAVQRRGNVLIVNDVEVAIAEACNGLRMVFALALVSFAFAYGTPLRQGVRVLVLVLSPIVAIVFNVLRLAPTVWLYGNRPLETADLFHDISGWAMLPIAFVSLLGVLRVLRWAQIPVTRFVLAYGT